LFRADEQFRAALVDDLNISPALAVLFDLLRELNTLCDANCLGRSDAQDVLSLLKKWDAVLGVLPLEGEEPIPQKLQFLLQQREEARLKKNYSLSDQLRKEIFEQGYAIEDTAAGARLKKKK
jgi:cysteinyl-tRNA synthetase